MSKTRSQPETRGAKRGGFVFREGEEERVEGELMRSAVRLREGGVLPSIASGCCH